MEIKKLILITLLVSAIGHHASADPNEDFHLSLLNEGVLAGAGVSVFVAGALLRHYAAPPVELSDPLVDPANMITVNYSKTADVASDVLQYATFFAPALLAIDSDLTEIVTIGVMYAETTMLAIGIKDSLKGLLPRYRPFMYGDSPPAELLADEDRYFAFPSGHTTMAFTGASFLTYMFLTKYPDSKLKIPVIIGSVLLAVSTATLRVLSGQHFVTDVLAGAVIGTACGLMVPVMHRVADIPDR